VKIQNRRRFIQGAAALAASGSMTKLASAAECDGARDLHLVNGRFLTMDAQNSIVSSVAVRDGRIVALGHGGGLGPCSRTINLKGATVIPGLMDSHVHFIRCGQNPGHEVRIIETATSVPELLQMITSRIKALGVPAGEFITCVGGWNTNGLAEKRLPTVAELNAAAPDHAVYLSTTGTGGAVTNTRGAAFFASKGVTVNPATGTLTATQGLAALQAAQTEADRQRGTAEAIDFAASLGLTCVTDMGTAGAAIGGLDAFKYALNLWRDGNLKLRIRLFFNSSNDPGFTEAEGKIIHTLNQMGDDVFKPLGVGERTNSSTTHLAFPEFLKFAAQHGWTVTQHSLSSGEIDFHIAAYQTAAQVGPIAKLRWTLDHVNPISDAQIAAVKALGIGLRLQGWNYTSAAPSGPPWRKLVDSGIPISGGTDSTNVGPFNPWLMMSYMTTMKNNAGIAAVPANQQITRLEALRLYTAASAFHAFEEDKLGSIEPGKLADLAVLSDDPLTVSNEKFKRIRSVLTLQAGNTVHEAARL
jgi:predicted amidohydrolase YtcJ